MQKEYNDKKLGIKNRLHASEKTVEAINKNNEENFYCKLDIIVVFSG
ncbi:hypothetical protein [Flavobacterium collinsii]|nr:hypothetical protein [Flavobacterium collinsii]